MTIMSNLYLLRCATGTAVGGRAKSLCITPYIAARRPFADATPHNSNSRILAPVNLATDIIENQALRFGAVLRMADHHLNLRLQGLMPHAGVEPFCVSQVCRTIGLDNLKEKMEQEVQECNVVDETTFVVPLISEIWVQALGTSSISFGHAISLREHVLGLATRVFVRLDKSTGKLMEISEEERSGVLRVEPPQTLTLPVLDKLEVPAVDTMNEVFTVQIGPQHCNSVHVDHAALADLVSQGLCIREFSIFERNLTMQYTHPVELGQTVSCRVHTSEPTVALYQTCESKEQLVAIGHLSGTG